jgi:asparagine synthase (glutamine-hydrolysing)
VCGIVGIRRFDGAIVSERVLERMATHLTHRGPDDYGAIVRGSVGLAHRRLSIIDVRGSRQPMSSSDDTLHVCFNGEILNYQDVRARTPYPYRTEGDTEVLLSTFARSGPSSVSSLIGQFAYALLSETDDTLWLVRDRLGVLPLYYYSDANMLVFASEIKAILAALPRTPAVDPASLDAYLAHRSVPAPWTLFDGVRKLPPGTYLEIGRAGIIGEPVVYWTAGGFGRTWHRSDGDAVDECATRLREAVSRSLVADVPVGAYLSGGLDSSMIVAMMRDLHPSSEIRTFSASFGTGALDESPFARRVSARFGTAHSEVHASPKEFSELWKTLTWHRDAPISEASDVAVYLLARAARAQGVKVVLSGEGSDELLGGYPKHRYARLSQAVGAAPERVRRGIGHPLERRMGPRFWRARTAVRALAEPDFATRLEGWFAPFTFRERRELLRGLPYRSHREIETGDDPLQTMLRYDLGGWLSDNLLERGDRMSMAASVELRPPYLDYDFVDWAMGLPPSLKVRAGVGKWVLRKTAKRVLPVDIADRAKAGFRVPLGAWFRGSLGADLETDLLGDDSFVGSTLNRDAVSRLIRRHASGSANEELRLWTLMSLEMWHRVFFRSTAFLGCLGEHAPSS